MTTLSVSLFLIICMISNCNSGLIRGIYTGYGNFPLRAKDAKEYCILEGNTIAIYDSYINGDDLAEICNQISSTKQVCYFSMRYHE